jgi:hypothetical protein
VYGMFHTLRDCDLRASHVDLVRVVRQSGEVYTIVESVLLLCTFLNTFLVFEYNGSASSLWQSVCMRTVG